MRSADCVCIHVCVVYLLLGPYYSLRSFFSLRLRSSAHTKGRLSLFFLDIIALAFVEYHIPAAASNPAPHARTAPCLAACAHSYKKIEVNSACNYVGSWRN